MPIPTDPHDFVSGTPAVADQVDERFKRIYDTLNPAEIGIDDSNIAAAANINGTKLLDASISTAKLANNAVTAGKIETQQAWQSVFVTNWANLVGTTPTIQYMKDSLGFVHFRTTEIIYTRTGQTIATGAVFATLPAGYRPGQYLHFNWGYMHSGLYNQSIWAVRLDTNGQLSLREGRSHAGQADGGQSGLIVTPETFRAEN